MTRSDWLMDEHEKVALLTPLPFAAFAVEAFDGAGTGDLVIQRFL